MGVGDELHLLYYGDVLWVYCGVEWSELGSGSFRIIGEISIQGSVCAE